MPPSNDPREVIEGKPRLGRVIDWIVSLAAGEFYGTVEIRFEGGHVQTVRKIESIRAEDLPAEQVPARTK